MYKYYTMAQPLISDNLDDFLGNIQTDLPSALYYKTSKGTYKIVYLVSKTQMELKEYQFISELNNTFRLIKTIPLGDKFAAINLIRHWYDINKKTIKILSKRDAFLFQKNITESNTCWKTPKQLGKAIKNGLEVPNCIPDSDYALDEAQVFILKKNRELVGKYKKTIDWLNDVISDGDKDYAEKLLQIVEKWKRYYEDKIRIAKSVLKETKDIITSAEVIKDEKKKIKFFLERTEKSYDFYTNLIKVQMPPASQSVYMDKLKKWYEETVQNLNKTLDTLKVTKDPTIQAKYTPFSLYDFDIMDLSESTKVKDQITLFIKKSEDMKSDLRKFKENSEFEKLSLTDKQKALEDFYKKHVK